MNAATPVISIVAYLFAAFLGALGQYLYKEGAVQVQLSNLSSLVTNPRIILGILCYIGVMFLFIVGLKKGGQLTVLYPVYATTFIWAALIGFFVLGESFTLFRILGTALIVTGVVFVAR
jgi:multidrug transporter EmrE-like cation transporter